MKKAVILARVSTLRQEKEGLSLKDIQLPELRDYAVKRDFEVVTSTAIRVHTLVKRYSP